MKSIIPLIAVLFCPFLLAQEEDINACYQIEETHSEYQFAEKICIQQELVVFIQGKETVEERTLIFSSKEGNTFTFSTFGELDEEGNQKKETSFECVLKENQLFFTATLEKEQDKENLKKIEQTYVLNEETLYNVLKKKDPDLMFDLNEKGDSLLIIQQMPEFIGGDQKMLEFIYGNIVYPPIARENGIAGMVVVSFIVMEDGSLSNFEIKRDIGAGCGEEALRVISMMPAWKPGVQIGKPVKVRYNLPVRFKFENNKKKKKKKKKKRG